MESSGAVTFVCVRSVGSIVRNFWSWDFDWRVCCQSRCDVWRCVGRASFVEGDVLSHFDRARCIRAVGAIGRVVQPVEPLCRRLAVVCRAHCSMGNVSW